MRSLSPSSLFLLAAVPAVMLGCWLAGDSHTASETKVPTVQAPVSSKSQPSTVIVATVVPITTPITETVEPEATAHLSQLAASLKAATHKTECRKLAQAIAALGTEDAAETLWQAAIAQTNPEFRTAILEGFDSVVSPEMITFTASVLKASTDPEILNAAKQLVTRGADMDTVGFLTELYSEAGSTEFRQQQIENAISTIRTEAAASALGALARNTELPRLAEAAAISLFTLGTPATIQQLTDARAALAASGTAEAEQILQSIDRLMKPASETASRSDLAQADGTPAQ